MQQWLSDLKTLSKDETFVFLAFTSAMCITGVTLISPALPAIAEGVSVTESEIGLLVTAFTLPAIFILPFSGFLADNLGRNKVMGAGALFIGIGGISAFFAESFHQLLLLRFMQGVGQAGVMPLTVALIGDLYNGSKQTQAQGMRGSFNKIGSISWPVVGGLLAALSWNNVFLVYSLFIPVGIIAYFKMPSNVKETRSPLSYMKGMKSVVERPKIATYLFLGFVRMFVKFSIITYIPILLTSRYSFSAGLIGGYMALRGIGGFISSSSAGLFDEKFGKQKPIVASFSVIALASLLVAMTDVKEIVVLMLLVYGFMDSMFSALHKSLLNQSVGDEHRTGLMTTNSLAQNIGSTAAPLAVGSLLYLNSEIWLYIIAALSITGALAFVAVHKNKRF